MSFIEKFKPFKKGDVYARSPEMLSDAQKLWDKSAVHAKSRIAEVKDAYQQRGLQLSETDYTYIHYNLTYAIALQNDAAGKEMDEKCKALRDRLDEIKSMAILVVGSGDTFMFSSNKGEVAAYGAQIGRVTAEIMNFYRGSGVINGREQQFSAATALSVNMINQIRNESISRLKD